MPLTALTMLIASVSFLISTYIVSHRLASSNSAPSFQAQLMTQYFLYMGIFCFLMFLPDTILNLHPDEFPLAMAWGYTVGHIFCYAGMISILRMTFSMVPRLANFDKLAIVFGVLVNIGLTILTAVTMIWGTRPQFDATRGVTMFNAHPSVGIGIAILGVITVVPAALLMLYNGITNPTARLRSFLLGGGFLLSMVGGPLHDNAKTAGVYMLADILTIACVLITTSGVLYRMDEKISVSRPIPATASSK